MRACVALRSSRAAEAVVRNEDIVAGPLFSVAGREAGRGRRFGAATAWLVRRFRQFEVVTPAPIPARPTLRPLIGQPGTTAQEPLADERCCGFPAQSGPVFNSSTPSTTTRPNWTRPAHRAAGTLAVAFRTTSRRFCERATHFANMSYVTRRALSTLIPPKVGRCALMEVSK